MDMVSPDAQDVLCLAQAYLILTERHAADYRTERLGCRRILRAAVMERYFDGATDKAMLCAMLCEAGERLLAAERERQRAAFRAAEFERVFGARPPVTVTLAELDRVFEE